MCVQKRETDPEGGFGSANEESRRRRAIFSISVEMKAVSEEEESRQGEATGKWDYGGERFVCISVEEMESYHRHSHHCQQLLCEFCKCVCVCVSEFKLWCVMCVWQFESVLGLKS